MANPSLQEKYFQISNVLYPLATGTGNSTLFDVDKCIFYLLDFIAGTLQANAGAKWTEAVTYLRTLGLASAISTSFVSPSRVGYNPVPFLQSATFKFPLLAVYRLPGGKAYEKTIDSFVRFEQDVEVLFILPPMSAAEMETLNPFLNAARDIIVQKNEHGYDPNWNNGEYIGPLAGYEKILATGFDFENIPTQTNLVMPTLIVRLKMYEINRPVNMANSGVDILFPATGLDGYVNLWPDGYGDPNPPWPDGYNKEKVNFIETNSNYDVQNYPNDSDTPGDDG
jgi:hypothetical protein